MSQEKVNKSIFNKQYFLGLGSGIVVGCLLLGIVMWQVMPGMMITTHVSKYSTVEETANQLKAAIAAEGWSCPAIRNMNAAMKKHGVEFSKPIRIVELCKAQYARAMGTKYGWEGVLRLASTVDGVLLVGLSTNC